MSGINHCWTENRQVRLYLNRAKRIGGVLKETKLPFILMDRSVVPVRKIYGEIFLISVSRLPAGYMTMRQRDILFSGLAWTERRKMLRRMGIGKGAVTDGPMPMKKDDLLNLPEDECIIVTFWMPAIKDEKICTKKQI